MSLDWDKLRVFYTVAEAGSFTHATQILNLSQSAISRQISGLEEQLGVALFHRHARGLLLTEQGELLLKTARDVFERLAMIEGQISDTKSTPEGVLKVTVPGFLGMAWLAPQLVKFNDKYPNIRLSMLLDNRVLNLSMREADVGVRLYEPAQADLIKLKIGNIGFKICASKAYLAKHGTPKDVSDLAAHTLVGYPSGVAIPHEHTDWLFKIANVDKDSRDNTILINSMQAIKNTVESGLGIACLPDIMIKGNPQLQVVLQQYPVPELPLYFVYPQERRHSTRIKVFRDFLVNDMGLN